MNTIDEKTFKQGVDEFIGCAPEGGWSDYWAMQQDWEFYKDSLCRDGVITQKQADSWSNPCTPETFARWQKRNGLVSRGYESKKSEASYDYQDPRGGTAASLFSLHMKELLGSWIKAGNRSKYKVYVTEDRSAGSPVWTVHIDVNGEPVASVSFSDGNYTYTRFDNNKTTTGKVADFNKRGMVIYPMATEILNMVGKILGEGDSNESKKSEDTYDRPVTLYASTRYDDAEEAQKFLDSISGGEVKVSKERNGDTLSVSIEGADEDIDAFLAVYKDNYDTLEKDCDADVNGWTDPVDLKYYTAQGRKELTGESHKKSEGIGDRIKMGIDYNMFMRMCGSAAYLDDKEDYWDALWEYYSEMGEIEDALVFFDNLFQYTAWCDVDELYDEYLGDAYKDKSKSKETCIQEAVDGGDLDAYKHSSGKYLVIL